MIKHVPSSSFLVLFISISLPLKGMNSPIPLTQLSHVIQDMNKFTSFDLPQDHLESVLNKLIATLPMCTPKHISQELEKLDPCVLSLIISYALEDKPKRAPLFISLLQHNIITPDRIIIPHQATPLETLLTKIPPFFSPQGAPLQSADHFTSIQSPNVNVLKTHMILNTYPELLGNKACKGQLTALGLALERRYLIAAHLLMSRGMIACNTQQPQKYESLIARIWNLVETEQQRPANIYTKESLIYLENYARKLLLSLSIRKASAFALYKKFDLFHDLLYIIDLFTGRNLLV